MAVISIWKPKPGQIIKEDFAMRKFILIPIVLLLASWVVNAQFPRDQHLVAGEYFINNDPGEGNGTSITGNYGYSQIDASLTNLNLPISSKIYVRFKSSNGIWSAPRSIQRKSYFENSGATLPYGEFFVNTDPGQGNGTPIQFEYGQYASANINGLNLQRGDRIYVRVKDSYNRWSEARPVQFNFKKIAKAEYEIQHNGGSTTNSFPMDLSLYNSYSCVFTAEATYNNWQQYDTVLVRVQTEDKFWSAWTKGPKGESPGAIQEFDKDKNLYLFCYPNPFISSTQIEYRLIEKSNVNLTVYDIYGKEIACLVNAKQPANKYIVEFNGEGIPNGLYFCILKEYNKTTQCMMILLK